MNTLWTRRAFSVVAALALAGCAGPRSLTSEVASFGEWPAGRAAGSYAFDRLPSQAANPKQNDALEASAVAALAKAGFKPVATGQQPDVLVQLGRRSSRTTPGPWSDPLWLRGGFGYWRPTPWVHPLSSPWIWHPPAPRYEREVAVLIRDRASGKPLFEARAASEGGSWGDAQTTGAMFEAALMDFPKLGVNPRSVTVVMAP
jgi:Domain of unknown function (DUF4136)